jgi:Family of unknown function (DUF5689)
MKNKSILFLSSLVMVILAALVITSCNKKFDEPPLYTDPGVTANTTIKQLRALSTGYGILNAITTDIIIAGKVVGNDKSGNIYKELYLQDSTAGIALQLDATGLYNSYPLGREVFVVCKGLYVANESGMIKLCVRAIINGSPTVSGIPSALIDGYVKRGQLGTPPAPKVLTIAQLNNDYQSMLIQLDNYQVTSADMGKTYADTSASKATQNINTQSCAGTSSNIIVRTSGYSNFAAQKLPQGNGALTAIYTVFASNASFNNNPTKQLILRDTSDMKFYGSRCGQGPTTLINTSDVRALYTSSAVAAPASRRITGIVISDKAAANMQTQNLVLQQGNNLSGIVVRFDAAHNFNLGDSIDVNITGGTIDKFSGVMQVATLSLSNALLISSGKTITPRVTTGAVINTNIDAWESTLIRLSNVTITGGSGGTWGSNGSTTINDGTGTITHFTRSGATFQATAYPTTATSITAIVSRFNTTNQIGIRNLTDVVGGTTGGGGTGNLLDENFTTFPTSGTVITGWRNISETGDVLFRMSSFSGNTFPLVSAFSSTALPTTNISTWLISPDVNLPTGTAPKLSFTCSRRYPTGTFKIYVSTNFTGSNVSTATWVLLTTVPAGTAAAFTPFDPFGPFDLTTYVGQKVNIGFRYEAPAGTAASSVATYEPDDIKITRN